MGLLVFMRNLLLALCLFLVLGFLYYSAWKLHLLRWEDSNSVVLSFDSVGRTIGSAFLVEQEGEREKLWLLCFRCPSHLTLLQTQEKTEPRKNPQKPWQLQAQPFPVEYDKLGFLLNLDSKLPPELASKYANFSEGVCKPGYASALMTVIFPKLTVARRVQDLQEGRGRIKEKFLVPWSVKLSGFSISPSSRLLNAWPVLCQGIEACCCSYLLSPPYSVFCKSQAKQTCKPKHTPSQLTPGVWVAPPGAELRGFPSNTSSHAVSCCSTVTAGNGMFCTSLPFFLCEFYEVMPFFSFIYWFWENFLSFFTSAVSVLGIIYNLKAVFRG
ncbi:CMP-N-acetylneuraminate-beta-1,4-galactoside alpha-2,3-sialyltransferase isoform X7 [Prinia subflava]|uniref:CMP-N-acetylneuraminate-beta-1,4-galactoside alpha-2,3-sialyltransferase isoform X7 n=1 Tax=Prinia subflava TaxID=208062 RepID=UPI002FE2EDD2